MRRIAGAVLLLFGLSAVRAGPGMLLRGFLPAEAWREMQFETLFRSLPTAERAEEDLRVLTQEPHVAGTPGDYRTAQYVLKQFQEAGLHTDLVEYDVLLAYPRKVRVDLVEPIRRHGPTPEAMPGRNASESPELSLPYNAYSPSGDVTAPVVYANYGLPEDYDRLKAAGIEVAGKIVLVRYGRCFRGVKASVAEDRGVAGLLIYSDPADDGYRLGEAFPRGPWRPPTAAQRGSILPLSDYSGDPLTPGIAATPDAPRLPLDKVRLPRVPTTPLAYEDASPILEHLEGPVAPPDWQGALPLVYHLGPGPSKVHLKLAMDFRVRPIWDVIAEIPGMAHPEEWVVVGNHRDAWGYGAADPGSGTAPLLAVGRGLGHLLRKGWRPDRTLILASWDAEEFGLMGSTEWTEDHARELAQHGVAYINVDIGVSGPHFNAAAVPSLTRLLREAAEDIRDPNSGRALIAVWAQESGGTKKAGAGGADAPPRAPWAEPPDAYVRELGSGSDYTPFLEHLGIASVNFGFEGPYGVYHSQFDDFEWMANFGDPAFRYSVTTSQIMGVLAMRLADADILPFDYEDYGKAIETYLGQLESELRRRGAADKLPLGDAFTAGKEFRETAGRVNRALEQAGARGSALSDKQRLNQALIEVERDFLTPEGLPGRAWFRHVFYAPGVYTGYSAILVPGLRGAVDRDDWPLAARQRDEVVAALRRATDTLRRGLQESSNGSVGR